MGEISGMGSGDGTTSHATSVSRDGDSVQKADSFQTDVKGVTAQSSVKRGKDEFPCFDVSNKEFYQNMNGGRQRIRFKKDSSAQQYMQGTKYKRKFYIKHTDDKGKAMVRSIK